MRTGRTELPLHGGKDGHPFPVDRATYDRSIEILRRSLEQAKIEPSDKRRAFGRLDAMRRIGDL
jgi:uncharacterized protein